MWTSKVAKQWGQAPITVRLATGRHSIGTLTPQRLHAASPSISWDSSRIGFDVSDIDVIMIQVLSLGTVPNTVLGMATLDVHAFLSSGWSTSQITLHVIPSHALSGTTIHAVVDVEMMKRGSEQDSHNDIPALETECLAVSSIDLFFPLFLMEESAMVISNVVAITNTRQVPDGDVVVKLVCSDGEALKCFPVGGITVRPNHRAYFSVTFNPKCLGYVQSPTLGSPKLPHFKVDIVATIASDLRPLPNTTLHVHLTPPRSDQLFAPFHYWVNGNCVSNRKIQAVDVPYIRSVLPIYLMQLDDEPIVVTDRDTGQQTLISAGGSTSAVPVCDLSALVATTRAPTTNKSRQLQQAHPKSSVSPRLRGTVDLLTQKCLVAITLGVLRGLPPPLSATPSQIRLTALPLDPRWLLQNGETPFMAQDANGEVHWERSVLVAKKLPGRCRQQMLRLQLLETLGEYEVPIGVGLLVVPDVANAQTMSTTSIAFHIFESYSRYDELPYSGALMRGVRVKFLVER